MNGSQTIELIRFSSLPDITLQFFAKHLVAEFGHLYPAWNLAAAIDELSQDPGQGLPLHLAAIEDGRPLGSASITADDEVTGWENQDWWLANVLVLPEHRGRKIGRCLINRAVDIASESGVRDLHLVTDTVENWYLKQGWKRIGFGDVHGHEMVVMRLQQPIANRSYM